MCLCILVGGQDTEDFVDIRVFMARSDIRASTRSYTYSAQSSSTHEKNTRKKTHMYNVLSLRVQQSENLGTVGRSRNLVQL